MIAKSLFHKKICCFITITILLTSREEGISKGVVPALVPAQGGAPLVPRCAPSLPPLPPQGGTAPLPALPRLPLLLLLWLGSSGRPWPGHPRPWPRPEGRLGAAEARLGGGGVRPIPSLRSFSLRPRWRPIFFKNLPPFWKKKVIT